jgi:hypothetical protein
LAGYDQERLAAAIVGRLIFSPYLPPARVGLTAGGLAMPPLTNSTTFVPKATYVPLTVAAGQGDVSFALQKFAFVRSLRLQPGEVDSAQAARKTALAPSDPASTATETLAALLKPFEATALPAQLPSIASFAGVGVQELIAFGNAVASTRSEAAADAQSSGAGAGAARDLLNAALIASKGLAENAGAPLVGMLNLERLEMTPAGLERGGLVGTIPLAPLERTAVVQQEWSVTSQEFTSIVTDSLENFSETGVTENTQLTQAAAAQVSHSNQTNVSASASGGIGFVTASGSASSVSQDQSSQSASDSRTHARQTTQQASSRVTQSHKTSISISTTTGESEASTRVLYNPSPTDAMRVDYFSIMRNWYVALYRYGLRLTYDLTIPAPAAAMREAYARLAALQAQAAAPFPGPIITPGPSGPRPLQYGDITAGTYQDLASQFGAQVSPPPASQQIFLGGDQYPGLGNNDSLVPRTFTLNVPDGYRVGQVTMNAQIGAADLVVSPGGWAINILGALPPWDNAPFTSISGASETSWIATSEPIPALLSGLTGALLITTSLKGVSTAFLAFVVEVDPTDAAIADWQATTYNIIYSAAQSTYYAQQQTLAAEITTLEQQLSSVDTLTLRREEHDEIMKCVLRWLLGDEVDAFMSDAVQDLFANQPGVDLEHGVDFTGADTNLSIADWSLIAQYEQMVSFINEAVDWDNIIYFLYSYFWDVPDSWDFIRQIQHPDSTRQAFLRAGGARVVLTVRKGWEVAWTNFVATGDPASDAPHPYLTIAEQIAAYDATSYPGIPAADPNNPDPLNDDDTQPAGTTCDQVLAVSAKPKTITVASSAGFVAGATAIIDTFASGVQEAQSITAVPDATHITVAAIAHPHTPATNDEDAYPVVQAGSKGLLIGEWYEYTPTSGIDIEVNSDLSAIA